MLFVLFQLGPDHYAIPGDRLVEVLPLVNLKAVPQSPPGVAGAFNYRGQSVPVIDLQEMLLGRPAARRLSTRILLVRYPLGSATTHTLGLIAERATETFQRDSADFIEPGIASEGAPYLGRVCRAERGLIQWVDIEKLLTPAVSQLLFQEAGN